MTTERKRTPEQRAREYAEGDLGVNAVYDRAEEALAVLGDRQEVVRKTAARRRELEDRIEDREMTLASEERAKNAEMSQAAFDRHIKVVFHEDRELQELRSSLRAVQGEHERAEHDADLARMTARVESARLEELGGLLRFYAAVKESVHQANDTDNR